MTEGTDLRVFQAEVLDELLDLIAREVALDDLAVPSFLRALRTK